MSLNKQKIRKCTYKLYECTQCGYREKIYTNHFGDCWSCGRHNTCPKCPPFRKYPEYGGQTMWKCLEKEG